MLISSIWFMPMSEANIVPSVSHDEAVGVPESVGVDLAERFRVAIRGELVGHRNRVVAEAFRAAGDRRTARIEAQDGGHDRVEALRLAGCARVRSAAVAESVVAAAGVEQAVVQDRPASPSG